MPPLTLAALRALAGHGGVIALHHGTDITSATDIQQHGLSIAKAQAIAATSDFWATDDANDADVFAQTNHVGGQAARLDFEFAANLLLQLLSASPPQAQLHLN